MRKFDLVFDLNSAVKTPHLLYVFLSTQGQIKTFLCSTNVSPLSTSRIIPSRTFDMHHMPQNLCKPLSSNNNTHVYCLLFPLTNGNTTSSCYCSLINQWHKSLCQNTLLIVFRYLLSDKEIVSRQYVTTLKSLSLPRKKHNLSLDTLLPQIYDRFGTKLLFVWYYVTKSLFLFTLFVIPFTISYLSMTSTIRYLISR